MYMDHLVSFIKETTYDDIPTEAIQRIKTAFIDTFGVAVAAEREPVTRHLTRIVPLFFNPQTTSVDLNSVDLYKGMGQQETTDSRNMNEKEDTHLLTAPLEMALRGNPLTFSLLFGTMAHALDYDDNSVTFQGHPSSVLVSTILGLAKDLYCRGSTMNGRYMSGKPTSGGHMSWEPMSGKQMMEAYAVGFEVLAKLSEVFVLQQYGRGWHTTATIGLFGAVASAAKILRLNEEEIGHALGIAGSLSSGIRKNFGTMTKPLHVGLTSMHAIMAAQLASGGINACPDIFSGTMGIDRLMANVSADFAPLATLGHQWDLLDMGITIKKYPCCASTHRSIDAALSLVREHSLVPSEIEAVDVFVHHLVPSILVYPVPRNELEAKFSMPFCVAAAIHDQKIDLHTFGRFNDENLRELSTKVKMSVHPLQREGLEPRERFAEVRIHTKERSYSKRVEFPKGHPGNPMSVEEVYAKFAECTSARMDQDQIHKLFDIFLSLEERSVDDVMSALCLQKSPLSLRERSSLW